MTRREREALDVAVAALLSAEILADKIAAGEALPPLFFILTLRRALTAARVRVEGIRGGRRTVRRAMRLEGIMRELLVSALPGPGPRRVR